MMRGLYDFTTKTASTELIWFVRSANGECWRQHRTRVEERCYEEAEILRRLDRAGFSQVQVLQARDAGVAAELGFGRIFVTGRAQK